MGISFKDGLLKNGGDSTSRPLKWHNSRTSAARMPLALLCRCIVCAVRPTRNLHGSCLERRRQLTWRLRMGFTRSAKFTPPASVSRRAVLVTTGIGDMLEKTYDPASVEDRIYAAWQGADCFAAGAGAKPGAESFSIVIPPPNVTGSLHI